MPEQRTKQYFYLGLSVGKLLNLPSGAFCVQALTQLLEEWEYHFASATFQSMKFVMANSSDGPYPKSSPVPPGGPNETGQSAGIYKWNGHTVYEHLLVPHIPFNLDYCEAVFSLCDVLAQQLMDIEALIRGCVYERFINQRLQLSQRNSAHPLRCLPCETTSEHGKPTQDVALSLSELVP